MKRKWTRGEKLLWAAPILVAVFGIGAMWGPEIARRSLGYPRKLEAGTVEILHFIALSGDGRTLAAAGISVKNKPQNGEVRVWDARTLKPQIGWPGTLTPAREVTSGLALSPDGRLLSLMRERSPLQVFDVQTRRLKWSSNWKSFHSKAHFSPDGKLLAVSYFDTKGAAYAVHNATNGRILSQWALDLDAYNANFAWAPDGRTLACVGAQRKVLISASSFTSSFAHDGCDVEIRRASDGKRLRTIVSPWTQSVAFSPDGAQIVVIANGTRPVDGKNYGEQVKCFSLVTGRELWSFGAERGEWLSAAQFSPDGLTVAALQSKPPRLAILNAQSGALERTLRLDGEVTNAISSDALAFAPDGKRLFARGLSSVLVWDLE